jgi:hypothetical protein
LKSPSFADSPLPEPAKLLRSGSILFVFTHLVNTSRLVKIFFGIAGIRTCQEPAL